MTDYNQEFQRLDVIRSLGMNVEAAKIALEFIGDDELRRQVFNACLTTEEGDELKAARDAVAKSQEVIKLIVS